MLFRPAAKKYRERSHYRLYIICARDTQGRLWFLNEYSFSLSWRLDTALVTARNPNRGDHCGYTKAQQTRMISDKIQVADVFYCRLHSKRCPVEIDFKDPTAHVDKYNWRVKWRTGVV